MGVIQLYFVELSKLSEIFMMLFIPAQDVSQRGRTEKVLLFQSQLFTLIGLVVRVQHTGDVLGGLTLLDGLKVVTFVEVVEVELVVRTRSPQSQIIGVVSVIAGHGRIVSLRDHKLAPDPLSAFDPGHISRLGSVSVEPNRVDHVGSFYLPWVALLKPVVWNFDLLAIFDHLLKNAVVVANTIAPSRNFHRCQTV